jgi:hypothetical protein
LLSGELGGAGILWAMPRYFFDVHIGSDAFPDEHGSTLSDAKTAGKEAGKIAAEIALDELEPAGPVHVEVRDEAGRTIFTMHCLTGPIR